MNFKRILWMYASGQVKRLHVVPLLREHTIAKHVYGSQMIAMELYECYRALDPNISLENILVTLLHHDAPEIATGDVPSPTKRALAAGGTLEGMENQFYSRRGIQMRPLNPTEQLIVELSDLCDLLMSCIEERRMGNRTRELADYRNGELSTSIEGVYHKVMGYLREHDDKTPGSPVKSLIYSIIQEWEDANGRE
jgi:5'-deoxynucleotidase YfbR-like HD superfamily hydrolase